MNPDGEPVVPVHPYSPASDRSDKRMQHACEGGVIPYPESYGQRVLVVDDDAHVRVLLSALLTHEGYSVVEAGDGLDALHKLRKRHFNLVISDYRMPRYDGMQLLASCRLLWPETAVIIASGESSNWMALAIRGGAHAWVRKHWERTHLISVVRQAIEKVLVRTMLQEVRS